MRRKVIAGIVVLALVASAIGVISARGNPGMQSPAKAFKAPCWMDQLTEEERQGVHQQFQGFMQQICDQYNLTPPSGPLSNLTEGEKAEMKQKIQDFKEQQRQEAQDFMQQICDEYNITCPSGPCFGDMDKGNVSKAMGPQGCRFWHGFGFKWFVSPP
jgi:hypothetical protein